MPQLMLDATIVNGRVEVATSLAAYEGQRVRLLVEANGAAANGHPPRPPASEPPAAAAAQVEANDDEIEPPDWLDVERDIGPTNPFSPSDVTLVGWESRAMDPCIIVSRVPSEDGSSG